MSSSSSLDQLVRQLNSAPDISVRRNAAVELFKLKDTNAIEPLVNALADHEDVAIFATLALVELGKACTRYIIEKGLVSSNEQQRAYSIEILGELGCEESLDAIIDILRKDRSERVRSAAVEAIGHFNDTRSTESLRSLLGDNDPYIVSLATIALYRKGQKEGLCDLLLDKLHQVDKSHSGILLWAMVEICDNAYQKRLTEIANSTDNEDLKIMINEVIHGIHLK